MSATSRLVNANKKEIIYFINLPVSTIGEIMMNHIASAMVVWYLSKNKGDNIYFINDYDDNDDLLLYKDYTEVSDRIIDEMTTAGYLLELEPKNYGLMMRFGLGIWRLRWIDKVNLWSLAIIENQAKVIAVVKFHFIRIFLPQIPLGA